MTLQRGQTYQLRTNSPIYGEQTGSIVTTDKPVAMIGGNDMRSDVRLSGNAYTAQLPPSSTGGTQFLVRPWDPRFAGKSYEVTVVAADGEATIFLNGDAVGRAFEWSPLVLSLTGVNRLQSDRMVQLVQTTTNAGGGGADFTMSTVPSTLDGSSAYLLSSLADEYASTLATITISDADRPSLRLNGILVDSSAFVPVADSDLLTGQISLSVGPSFLTADRPFRVLLSGFAPPTFRNFFGGSVLDTSLGSFATPAGLEFGDLSVAPRFRS